LNYQVTIDTHEIVDSKSKLLYGNKDVYFLEEDKSLIMDSPDRSFLGKLKKSKIDTNKYLMIGENLRDGVKLYEKGWDVYVFFMRRSYVEISSIQTSYLSSDFIHYTDPEIYHECLYVFYYRKKLDEDKKKHIHKK
jgi:hypothetical protein